MTLLYIIPPLLNKNIAIFEFCWGWTVGKCTKLFAKISWKPRNWKNKSVHQVIETSLFTLIWWSYYIFVENFSDFKHRINVLQFLDSAKVGFLKNVQNQFSRCFGSREMSRTKAGTFSVLVDSCSLDLGNLRWVFSLVPRWATEIEIR